MEDNINLTLKVTKVNSLHEIGIIDILMQSFPGKEYEQQKSNYHFLNYENPAQDFSPLGLVVVHEDTVVGYLGFIGLPFMIGDKRLKILIPHSTATHIKYRRKGISTKIFEKSLDLFREDYILFLGTSYTSLSIMGRIKQKWKILGDKDYLFKMNFSKYKKHKKNNDITFERKIPNKIIKSIFEDSVFSESLKIRIDLSSIEFINWIFNKEGYKWAVLRNKNKAIAYCCFTVKKSNCNLIHFDMISNDESLKKLLKEIGNKYSIKGFYYFSTDIKSIKRNLLRKLGFWSTNVPLVRKILRKEIFPILFRPTTKEFDSSYFIIHDIDTKDVNNWDITKLSNF